MIDKFVTDLKLFFKVTIGLSGCHPPNYVVLQARSSIYMSGTSSDLEHCLYRLQIRVGVKSGRYQIVVVSVNITKSMAYGIFYSTSMFPVLAVWRESGNKKNSEPCLK